MSRFGKLILLLSLLTLLAAPPVWAKKKAWVNPVPADVTVQWVPVPQVAAVQYAPNLPADFFRYQGKYYYYFNNLWYLGPAATGPWQQLQAPPPVFYQIQPVYFKTPPGWSKGKKKGWGGAPLPPGQMKKYAP